MTWSGVIAIHESSRSLPNPNGRQSVLFQHAVRRFLMVLLLCLCFFVLTADASAMEIRLSLNRREREKDLQQQAVRTFCSGCSVRSDCAHLSAMLCWLNRINKK